MVTLPSQLMRERGLVFIFSKIYSLVVFSGVILFKKRLNNHVKCTKNVNKELVFQVILLTQKLIFKYKMGREVCATRKL